MRFAILALLSLAVWSPESIQSLMEQAFYPALLGVLVIASLGLPIPEDIPLITAGVILKMNPAAASWHGTLIVAMIGIMSGDLVLYSLGRRWGRDVVRHRSISWIITPERFERAVEGFHKRGTWYVFFGRFFMGVRAVMCIVAGATRFPYWRFFLADFAGALLSVPFFVYLGYVFAGMLPTLMEYVAKAESGMLVGLGVLIVVLVIWRVRVRKQKQARARLESGTGKADATDVLNPPQTVAPLPKLGARAKTQT